MPSIEHVLGKLAAVFALETVSYRYKPTVVRDIKIRDQDVFVLMKFDGSAQMRSLAVFLKNRLREVQGVANVHLDFIYEPWPAEVSERTSRSTEAIAG